DGDNDGDDLGHQLTAHRVAFGREAAERGGGDDPGADGAQDAPDAMHAEDVEAVVVLELGLQPDDGPQAHETGKRPEDDGTDGAGKAGSRGDGDEAGDGARGG